MALLAEEIPEDDRKRLEPVLVGKADFARPLGEEVLGLAGLGQPRHVALDVGAEHGHAGRREALREDLEGYRLAGAGGAGDQAVPVAIAQFDVFRLGARADVDLAWFKYAHNRLGLPRLSDETSSSGAPRQTSCMADNTRMTRP